MKYVKMLGLAAVAAAALMAFVGASSASATVLCTTNPLAKEGEKTGTTCPANQAYPTGTEIHAVLEEEAVLTTSFLNIQCPESTVSGKTNNEGGPGEAVTGNVEVLTFENCTNCADVTVLNKGTLSISWIEGTHNGTLSSSGAEVTVSCSTVFGTVHCIYKTNGTDLGTATGGAEATMDIESANIPRLVTSALCAEKANWDAKYKITSPKPLFVAGHT